MDSVVIVNRYHTLMIAVKSLDKIYVLFAHIEYFDAASAC